jgi:hypothetical protein
MFQVCCGVATLGAAIATVAGMAAYSDPAPNRLLACGVGLIVTAVAVYNIYRNRRVLTL